MRTIKLSREEFRTWRENHPPTSENELGGRDELKKQLLERNGGHTFKLMSPMARFIGTVRGENSTVGTAAMGVQNGAPSPESCVCKAFAGTKPGSHHDVCQFRQAWENGKGLVLNNAPQTNLNPAMNVTSQKVAAPIDTTPRVQHMQVAREVSAHQAPITTTARAVPSQSAAAAPAVGVVVQVPAVVALIPPEQCDCRQFAKPSSADQKQHHFICQHFDKWKTAHPTPVEGQASDTEKPPPPDEETMPVDYVLVDLDSQSILRDATSEEIELARTEEAATGSPLVTLDEGVYAVIERPRAKQAVAS